MKTALAVMAVAHRVSPPVSVTHVGRTSEPVAAVSHRAALSHRVPPLGPQVEVMTK